MAKQIIQTTTLWGAAVAAMNDNYSDLYQNSGWAQYQDTILTEVAPLSLIADTPTILPNNAGAIIDFQMPADVTTFYNGSTITGRNGDGLMITVDLIAKPTNAGTSYMEIWFDIGAPVGELYRRVITFPKGNGIARPINFTVSGYTLGTWEANGATVWCQADNTADLYSVRYVLSRTHKAQ